MKTKKPPIKLSMVLVLIILMLIPITLGEPSPEFIFRDQNGNQIQGVANITERPDGRLNVFITFTDQNYILDEINVVGLLPLIQEPIEISLGDYKIIPENPEYYIEETSSHLLGLNAELDFEEATIKLKKHREIKYLLECVNWDATNFQCTNGWQTSVLDFTQDENSITFTTTHFSGWVGGSWMYDDFETGGVSDYCQTSNATAAGWTGRTCQSGSGTFEIGSYNCFMDDNCGNLTAEGGASRTEVYKDTITIQTNDVCERVYFKEDCNNPLSIPSGGNKFWVILTSSNDTQGTGRVMLGFNENENLTCGIYKPNFHFCSGVTPQEVNCGGWHYAEVCSNDADDNMTCYLNGEAFCSEQGIRDIPAMRYGVLGKGKGTNDTVTGTLYFDEYRFAAKYIGGYPIITNLTEKKDPINENQTQQLNATIKDLDDDLDTVWIAILDPDVEPPWKNYTVTNHVGDEYYFDYGSGNYSSGETINYNWYANDSNGQFINQSGFFNVSVSVNNETQAREAILEGINNIIPNSSKTYDQQIYISYPDYSQDKGYFDVFALYSQQRWAFNYLTGNETFENMTSLRTTVNILEMENLDYNQIVNQVESFINESLD